MLFEPYGSHLFHSSWKVYILFKVKKKTLVLTISNQTSTPKVHVLTISSYRKEVHVLNRWRNTCNHETLKVIRWVPVALPCKITFRFPMQAVDHQSCSCPTRECKLVINHHYLQWQVRRLFTNRNTPTKQQKVKTDGYPKLSLNFYKDMCWSSIFWKGWGRLVNPTDACCKIFPTKKKVPFEARQC